MKDSLAESGLQADNHQMRRPISIVTVSYDTFFFVRLLVEKVRELIGSRSYELIVVDRGSRDGTREWLDAQADVRVLTVKPNRRGHGHGEAAELGVERPATTTSFCSTPMRIRWTQSGWS
jgi:GT2 family glycosyltransferase